MQNVQGCQISCDTVVHKDDETDNDDDPFEELDGSDVMELEVLEDLRIKNNNS